MLINNIDTSCYFKNSQKFDYSFEFYNQILTYSKITFSSQLQLMPI